MDEEYLLINSDYQFKELLRNNNKSNLSTTSTSPGRQNCPSIDHAKVSFIRDKEKSKNVKRNNQISKDCENSCEGIEQNDNISVNTENQHHSSTTFKCFEQFNDIDDTDINYLKGTFYVDNLKSCETTTAISGTNVKLFNGVLNHRISLCPNNPRVKAISSCSSLLRHSISMPNTCLIAHSSRKLKLTINPRKAPNVTSNPYTPQQNLSSNPQKQITITPHHHHTNNSFSPTNTTSNEDTYQGTYPALEDHRYYARRTPGSPPPAKRRSFMPQFKSSSASTINSAVTSISDSNHAKHINIVQRNNCNNYNSNSFNYGSNIYTTNSCNYNSNNNKNNNNMNNTNNMNNNKCMGGETRMSILETFLRATFPLDPSKGA